MIYNTCTCTLFNVVHVRFTAMIHIRTSTNTTAGIVCRRDIIDVITTIPMAGKSDLSFRNVAAGWEGKFQP